jgi:formate dehydrogenase assembly factor FdhD
MLSKTALRKIIILVALNQATSIAHMEVKNMQMFLIFFIEPSEVASISHMEVQRYKCV